MEAIIEAPAQRFGKFLLFDRISGEGRRETRRARAALRGFAVHLTRLDVGATDLAHFFPVFVEEMSRAGFLFHRAIQQTFEFGQVDGVPFYTGENIDGLTVATLLAECRRQRVPLPVPSALYIASEIASALQYAEGRRWGADEGGGVVHSALGPHEIFITDLGEVKLGGFGVYRALNRVALLRPFLDEISTDCLAPEGLLRKVDARADVYGCVALLYALLTFRAPRESALHGRPPPPSSLRGRVRPELDALCALGLADDPASRAFNALELERELSELLSDEAPSFSASDLAQFLVGLRDGTLGRALDAKRRSREAHYRRDTMGLGGAHLDTELTQKAERRPSAPVTSSIPIALSDTELEEVSEVAPAARVTPVPAVASAAASDPRMPVTVTAHITDPELTARARPTFAAGTAETSYAWVGWAIALLGVAGSGVLLWLYLSQDDKPAVTASGVTSVPERTPAATRPLRVAAGAPSLAKDASPPKAARPHPDARAASVDGGIGPERGQKRPVAPEAATPLRGEKAEPEEDDPFPARADEPSASPPRVAAGTPERAVARPTPTQKRPAVWASLGAATDEPKGDAPAEPPPGQPSERNAETPAPTESSRAAKGDWPREGPEKTNAPGFLSLTSELWATVTIDGTTRLSTPIVKRALSPGTHTLELYNPDNQLRQTLVVRIRSGATVLHRVTWGE